MQDSSSTRNQIANNGDNIRLVVFGYRQYNIVHCQDLYYGWPWTAGRFSLEEYRSVTVPTAVEGESIMSVKKLIDVKLGPPTVEEENQHDWEVVQQDEASNIALAIQEEKMIQRNPKDVRFLLIKPWGFGFWSDVHDVWAKLLLAEITDRQPIVFWGKDSLYSVGDNFNSFEQYFLPVSDYSCSDVVSDKYTYHPQIWNSFNVFQTDPTKMSRIFREVSGFINSNANVLVSDTYNYPHELMPWISEDHPAYGLDNDNAYRYIHNKYIKLQPDIAQEIDEFYHAHMETEPILAVHVRGGLKLTEGAHYTGVNAQTPHEIDCYLKDNPSARIFLLTDDEAILEQYKKMYGDILIYTDCTRKTISDIELCLKDFPDQRRKGIEIIKDTYLACRCDSFIGNWGSGVSLAISRLKVWDKGKIKLLW